MSKEIVVFSKNGCMPCKMTKDYLDRKGVGYEEKNISTDPKHVDEAMELGLQGVPVVLVDGEVYTIGFEPDKLDKL